MDLVVRVHEQLTGLVAGLGVASSAIFCVSLVLVKDNIQQIIVLTLVKEIPSPHFRLPYLFL